MEDLMAQSWHALESQPDNVVV